jgi:RNA-directed DNA polymerase
MHMSGKKQAFDDYFCNIRSLNSLGQVLKTDVHQLELLAERPPYRTFRIPKADGNERVIEDPGHPLKFVLQNLNKHLQRVYSQIKPDSSFGFISRYNFDKDCRNILTNARKHLNKDWLLKIDLIDFFHYVSTDQVAKIFRKDPFQFPPHIADLLSRLSTYQAHLPMGAPTSPVLSNFACIALDKSLAKFSENNQLTYTRYADDFVFSSTEPITPGIILQLRDIIGAKGFLVNPKKTQLLGPHDPKIVTGILLRGKGELSDTFKEHLNTELQRLQEVVKSQYFFGEMRTPWVEKMKAQVLGRISFAGFVLGKQHDEYIHLKNIYYSAIHPPVEEFGSVSWNGFQYL